MSELFKVIIPIKLFCPHCGAQHVDEERNGEKWQRRAHTTHRCQGCGRDWDVYASGAQHDTAQIPREVPQGALKELRDVVDRSAKPLDDSGPPIRGFGDPGYRYARPADPSFVIYNDAARLDWLGFDLGRLRELYETLMKDVGADIRITIDALRAQKKT